MYEKQLFRVTISCAVLDLPAKASFQQLNQFNGYFACGYCLQEGEHFTKKGVKYPWRDDRIDARTHDIFLDVIEKIWINESHMEYGIKGITPAISFDHFDLANSFGLDYLHCVLNGPFKNMSEFWLNPSKKHDSYIMPKEQSLLNKRIREIKPCRYISRLPRSMEYRKLFKASECRSLLLYYLPVVLNGFLKSKYLSHFKLLSESIYILLGTNISSQDLIVAESNLNIFVQQYEQLYGKLSMTMNIHLLTHLVQCVKNLGPLWSQSMFSFESNNATISRYVKGCNDLVSEISTRYMVHKSLKPKVPLNPTKSKRFSFVKKIQLSSKAVGALNNHGMTFDIEKPFKVFCVYQSSKERFTSMNYDSAKKTIDYVVELKDKTVGKIEFFFEYNSSFYILLGIYDYVGQVLHIHEIKPKNIELVYPVDQIEKKFIYINYLCKHYITEPPNRFESD